MYIYYSIGNNLGPQTLVRIVDVSVIGGVHFRRFHCITFFRHFAKFNARQIFLLYGTRSVAKALWLTERD